MGYLHDVSVLELADEQGEYAGKLLAGLGADVIKVEPPGGNETRDIGPFLSDGHVKGKDNSLYFWHYNHGKRGVSLDLGGRSDQDRLFDMARRTDIFLESTPRDYLKNLGITYDSLRQINPGLIWVRITPFGDDGPWADYKGSDLVHMALGGVMMCTGYDSDPITGTYDSPPIAPQMFQSYHIAGQHAVMATLGALVYRHATGFGQFISAPVHQAVATNTEIDVPNWVYTRQPVFRQTCRHAGVTPSPPDLGLTKDGRYVMTRNTPNVADGFRKLIEMLKPYGGEDDLGDDRYQDPEYRARPEVQRHINDVSQRFITRFRFEGPWHLAQSAGMVWTALRRPEENLTDSHWRARASFTEVDHPELNRSFSYVGAPWYDADTAWRTGPRAPLLNENSGEPGPDEKEPDLRAAIAVHTSPRGKPFAMNGVRVVDLTWLLASGGGPRFLSALGAEVIKVEWRGRWDATRFMSPIPDGGRRERDVASGPCPPTNVGDPNRAGIFNEINPGKHGISLNMNHPKGKELFRKLIEVSDVVCEGFSPKVMARWGFGYDNLKKINPTIVYVQQSGMGQHGTYGEYRATGPVAASLAGLSEMSGLPEPWQPAGIGYSYLDWYGAYNIATAMLAGIYHREKTGRGVYIDSSQVESGIYLNGSAILNWSANGRRWQRYGNRSPWKAAAPAGAYQCKGDDRWIAITCHTQDEWQALVGVLGGPAWAADVAFETLESRLRNQDKLDELVNTAAKDFDVYELMEELQHRGVPAGVCQTAEDRCDRDQQLQHLGWQVELDQRDIGRWPVKEFPVQMSETPPYMGGPINRGGPSYGEGNNYIYNEILGLSTDDIESLRAEDVI